jgi:hypothetical protein
MLSKGHQSVVFFWFQMVISGIPKSMDVEIHTLLMTDENSRGILLASEK